MDPFMFLFTQKASQFVQRDFNRTPEDDWKLNVQGKLQDYKTSLPVTKDGIDSGAKLDDILGWMIS